MARRSSGGNSCCPVIRVRCRRKYGRGVDSTITARAARGGKLSRVKKLKAQLRRALSGIGNVHPHSEHTSLPAAAVTAAKAAGNPAMACTVSMGGRQWKLKGAAVGQKVSALVNAQKAKRCIPLVQR